jgi:hypothetical protein
LMKKLDKICYFTVSKASSIGLAIEKTSSLWITKTN